MSVEDIFFRISKTWDGFEIGADDWVSIDVKFSANEIGIVIDAPFYNDPKPANEPGPTDGLWNYEVVEVFLVGDDGQYLELEFGPHGHYLMLWLTEPRKVVERLLSCRYKVSQLGAHWRGEVHFPRAYAPRHIHSYNAFAISGSGTSRRYLAWHPMPCTKPDFHQPKRFPLAKEL